jgi:hypothetical protein
VAVVVAAVAAVAAIATAVKAIGEAADIAAANDGKSVPGEAEPADAEEPEGLRVTYRARRIALKHLKTSSKWLIWAVIVQIVLVAVLMALQRLPQPLVNSEVQGAAGDTLAVPLAVFIVMVISIAGGYWFGLAGALRVRPGAGIPIAALVTWTLAAEPVSQLRLGGTRIDPGLSDVGLRWAQLGVLAVFWIWLGCVTVARRRAQRHGPAAPAVPNAQPWHPAVFWGALACVLSYYALELTIWVLYAWVGQAAIGTGSLLEDLGVQAVLLPTFLVFVVLLGSTDLLEWGEIAVHSIVRGTKRDRPRWLLAILTPLAALATIANVIRLDGADVLLELAVVGIAAALLATLIRLVPGYGGWSPDIRSRAVVAGAVVTFSYITILLAATSAIRGAIGWSAQLDPRFYWLVSTPLALAALTVGLFLLADGRIGESEQRGRGLVLVIVGGLIIIAELPFFLSSAHLPGVLPQHFSLPGGLQAVASLGTLGWLTALAVHGRLKEVAAAQLARVLALLGGLQLVSWIFDLLNEIGKLSADSDYLLGALFFLTVFWGFATSGEDLTGRKANSAAYPRDGRILLVVSYTLISNAILLYLGALRSPPGGPPPPDYLTADPVTPIGLVMLGSALVIVAFVTSPPGIPAKAGRAREEPANAGGSRTRPRRVAQALIAGVGAAATGAALVVLGTALPQLTQANAALLGAPYTAAVPGPGCDTGGALWTVTPGEPITTTCGTAGIRVQISAGPNLEGDIKFLPQNGFTSQNYRISVKLAFNGGFDGCAGIFTRASAAGRYLTVVCSDGSVDIDKFTTRGSRRIYLNFVNRAPSCTITALSAGTEQSVYVDGAKVGTVQDAALAETEYIGLGIMNGGDTAESAVFSKFSFTPLPARADLPGQAPVQRPA